MRIIIFATCYTAFGNNFETPPWWGHSSVLKSCLPADVHIDIFKRHASDEFEIAQITTASRGQVLPVLLMFLPSSFSCHIVHCRLCDQMLPTKKSKGVLYPQLSSTCVHVLYMCVHDSCTLYCMWMEAHLYVSVSHSLFLNIYFAVAWII